MGRQAGFELLHKFCSTYLSFRSHPFFIDLDGQDLRANITALSMLLHGSSGSNSAEPGSSVQRRLPMVWWALSTMAFAWGFL
eukprot:15344258-Ditylum_brightwellii.AAC.1